MALADFDPQMSIPDPQVSVAPPPMVAPGLAAAMPQDGPVYGPPEAPSPQYGNMQIGGGLSLPGQAQAPQVIRAMPGDVMVAPGGSLGARIQAEGAGQQGVAPPQAPGTAQAPMFFHNQGAAAQTAAPVAAKAAPVAMPPDLVGKDLQEQKKLTSQAAENQAQGEAGVAGQQANAAQAKADYSKEMEDRAKANASWSQGEIDNIRALNENAAAYKVDPGRYMKNSSFMSKGLLTLGAGLSGLAQGFLHQSGPNPALEQMNKNIERDIDAQKNEQEQLRAKGQDASNLYSMNLRALGNEDAARDASHAHALEAMADQVKAQTSLNGSQTVRDQGALAANGIQTQADTMKQKALAAAAASQASALKEKNEHVAELAGHLMTSGKAGTDAEALAMAQRAYGTSATGAAPIAIAGKTAGQQAAHDDALKSVTGTPFTSVNWNPTRNIEGSSAEKSVEVENQRREQMIQTVMTSGRPGTQRYAAAEKIVDGAYATNKPMPAEKAQARITAFRKAFGGQVLTPAGAEAPEPEGTP